MKKILSEFTIAIFYILAILGMIVLGGGQMALWPQGLNYALMFGQWGPGIAAIVVILILYGKAGLLELWKSVSVKKLPLKYVLLAVIIPLVCCSLSYVAFSYIQFSGLASPLTRSIPNYLVCTLATLFSVAGEEIGWRGFMLPQLTKKHSLFMSSLIVGLLWGLWHFRFQSVGLAIFFIIGVIEYSFIASWLYVKTNKNIFVAIIFHTAINMCSLVLFEKYLLVVNSEVSIVLNTWVYGLYAIAFALPTIPIAIDHKLRNFCATTKQT